MLTSSSFHLKITSRYPPSVPNETKMQPVYKMTNSPNVRRGHEGKIIRSERSGHFNIAWTRITLTRPLTSFTHSTHNPFISLSSTRLCHSLFPSILDSPSLSGLSLLASSIHRGDSHKSSHGSILYFVQLTIKRAYDTCVITDDGMNGACTLDIRYDIMI